MNLNILVSLHFKEGFQIAKDKEQVIFNELKDYVVTFRCDNEHTECLWDNVGCS